MHPLLLVSEQHNKKEKKFQFITDSVYSQRTFLNNIVSV